ncbi:MAG: hypothetical protein WA005_08570 [Candidatus Binataceae bacterium]
MMARKSIETVTDALKHEGDVAEWLREYVDFHNRLHDTTSTDVHCETVLGTDGPRRGS